MIDFDFDNTVYLQAENKRCYVVTTSGYFTVSKSLSDLTACLPDNFFKIHRSVTVNLDFIKSFDESNITLDNGIVLPLSRYKYKDFLTAFSEHLIKIKKTSV